MKAINRLAISLWPVEDPNRFGVADFDQSNRAIKRFQEKPSLEEAYSNLINAGCYIIETSVKDLSTEPTFHRARSIPIVSQSQAIWGVLLYWEVHRRWNSKKLP